MTKETLKQAAENYLKELAEKKIPFTPRNVNEQIKQAHIAGALSRQPEIDEAKEIIKEWQKKVCKELSDSCCPSCECCLFGEIKARTEQFLGDEK